VVDLAAEDAERLPATGEATVSGVKLSRLAVGAGADPLPALLALLQTST
jgi:hypothetical protein